MKQLSWEGVQVERVTNFTSLQQLLVKTGGRLVKHARYYWLLLAEGHFTRRVAVLEAAGGLGWETQCPRLRTGQTSV